MSSDTGDQLRRARQTKGLTIADAARATRIKARYLEALEEGRWHDLPGPVQARGFMRNYAAFLGLEGDALTTAFIHEAEQAPAPAVPAPPPAPTVSSLPPPEASAPAPPLPEPLSPPPAPVERPVLPAWVSLDMIAGGAALVLFAIVALLAARAYVVPLVDRLAASPEPNTATARVQPVLTPTRPLTPTVAFPVHPNGIIQIGLAALEHAWVRVTTDGVTAFEGLIEPGKSWTWEAREQLIVETGNGAAFTLAVNGKTMGALGARDRITIRAWSPRGEVVPPPTPTALPPTETPEPAPTLVPTPAP